MNNTLGLPHRLRRWAKVAAATQGRRMRHLLEKGLELVLELPLGSRRDLATLMRDACGVVDSCIPDLGSNPRHLDGFGCDAPGDR